MDVSMAWFLKQQILRCTRERLHITDILHSCQIHQQTVKAKTEAGMHCNKSGAEMVGKEIARMAKEKNINQVVFDRNGYIYHGRVKAVADGAREGGLEF